MSYYEISTQNQDQRQGRYHPHRNVSKFTIPLSRTTQVKCFDCGEHWEHPQGDAGNTPEKCGERQ